MSNESTAVALYTDGTLLDYDISEVNAESINEIVGGWFQAVPVGQFTLWVNEEGKLLGLPHNEMAQVLWDKNYGKGTDYIVGNALITGGVDDEGETLGLTTEQRHDLIDLVMA